MSSSEFTIVWDTIHKSMIDDRLVQLSIIEVLNITSMMIIQCHTVLVTVTQLCVKPCTRLWLCVAAADEMW